MTRKYRSRLKAILWLFIAVAFVSCGSRHDPETVNVAVATNFTEPAKEIAQIFEQKTRTRILLSFGSTGQLYAQITQDAPFELLLSADDETPRKIVEMGLAVPDSVFTYAIGNIVLFSRTKDLSDGEAVLRRGEFDKLAIANPATAPYGKAAMEAIKSLSLETQLAGKIVQGNNITQTFQFVETTNAEVGFVARSQVLGEDRKSIWLVPQKLYTPIRQDVVLLKKGSEDPKAREFISFLKSPESIQVIEKFGYSTSR